MSESENNQQIKDKIRIQIAIGLIAISSAIFYLVYGHASYEGNVLGMFLAYVLYGFYVISIACFFMYIILSGLHYKYKNENYAKDFYFPEKFRRFIYDFGIEIMILGFLYSIFIVANETIQRYIDLSNRNLEILIGSFGGSIILLIVIIFHQFFIDTEKKSK